MMTSRMLASEERSEQCSRARPESGTRSISKRIAPSLPGSCYSRQGSDTVHEVAERLNLHVKTVRRLIGRGKLPAKRIGKEYRITRAALDDFAGTTPPIEDAILRTRRVIASSIVDVDAISPEESQRITTLIMAGLNGRKGEPDFPRVDSLYDAERGRLLRTINALAAECPTARFHSGGFMTA